MIYLSWHEHTSEESYFSYLYLTFYISLPSFHISLSSLGSLGVVSFLDFLFASLYRCATSLSSLGSLPGRFLSEISY